MSPIVGTWTFSWGVLPLEHKSDWKADREELSLTVRESILLSNLIFSALAGLNLCHELGSTVHRSFLSVTTKSIYPGYMQVFRESSPMLQYKIGYWLHVSMILPNPALQSMQWADKTVRSLLAIIQVEIAGSSILWECFTLPNTTNFSATTHPCTLITKPDVSHLWASKLLKFLNCSFV